MSHNIEYWRNRVRSICQDLGLPINEPENPNLRSQNFIARYKQQRGKCLLCGDLMLLDEATRDHFIPKAKGGKNCWDNIALVHRECNCSKADKLPDPNLVKKFARVKGVSAQLSPPEIRITRAAQQLSQAKKAAKNGR